jgi:hypothetical protein
MTFPRWLSPLEGYKAQKYLLANAAAVIPGRANGSRERAPDDRFRTDHDVQLHI